MVEAEVWELVDAHCALVQGLRKTQHRCLEPPEEARPRGSAGREAPASRPQDRASPCARVLGALLSGMPVGDTVRTPGYLPASRPSDFFSAKGDVIVGAVTPLHAVLGQPKVTFRQLPCPPWVILFTHVDGGERRGEVEEHS